MFALFKRPPVEFREVVHSGLSTSVYQLLWPLGSVRVVLNSTSTPLRLLPSPASALPFRILGIEQVLVPLVSASLTGQRCGVKADGLLSSVLSFLCRLFSAFLLHFAALLYTFLRLPFV